MSQITHTHNLTNWYIPLAIAFLISACGTEQEQPERPDRESVEIRPAVTFDITDDKPLYLHIETQGIVEPAREIKITPRISGFVQEHNIVEGRQVSSGDILLAFVDDEWQLDLADAKNEFEKEYSRYLIEKRLRYGDNIPSEYSPELISMRNQLGITQSKIRKDRTQLKLDYARISAPFDGFIHTRENLSSGQYVAAGTQLGTLVDQTKVKVRFELLDSELEQITSDMPVILTTSGGQTINGTIQSVSPVVNPETKTGQVVAVFENTNGLLRSGMTVDGRILIQEMEGRTRAPRSALLYRDGRPLVFRLSGDTVYWVYIDPIAYTSDWVIFTHDEIAPGDTLAVDRHFAISHLQKVDPRLR